MTYRYLWHTINGKRQWITNSKKMSNSISMILHFVANHSMNALQSQLSVFWTLINWQQTKHFFCMWSKKKQKKENIERDWNCHTTIRPELYRIQKYTVLDICIIRCFGCIPFEKQNKFEVLSKWGPSTFLNDNFCFIKYRGR
jgi:hypothetical protein